MGLIGMVLTKCLVAFILSLIVGVYSKPADKRTNEKTAGTMFDDKSVSWLQRYGYVVPPDPKSGKLLSDSTLSKSLAKLQRFAGLRITGKLDDETKKLMQTNRCGVADFDPAGDRKKRRRRYARQGSKWQKYDLTWRLTNDNYYLRRSLVKELLQRAFDVWAKYTDLTFTQQFSGEADIMVSFQRYSHDDTYPFDGEGGTLAHAFYPHHNRGISGDIHFDDDERFIFPSREGTNFLLVAIHEIGHSLGLEHSSDAKAVMYPWYRREVEYDLKYDDISGIQSIYGSPRMTTPQIPKSTTPPTKRVPDQDTKVCLDQIKAIYLGTDGRSYVINDEKMYILHKTMGVEKGPIPVESYFSGVKTVDAAYTRRDGNIVLFSGKHFYVFRGQNKISGPTLISTYYDGLSSAVPKIDGAFVWSGNDKTYLFSSEYYWRFDSGRQAMDTGYPKKITHAWKGVPANIDAVFVWNNGKTYFFKGTKYYRISNSPVKADSGYPRLIWEEWAGCDAKFQARGSNSGDQFKSSKFIILTILMSVSLIAPLV